MSAECAHPDFDAQCIVTRLEDTGLFSMDVRVWCKVCAKPFEFPESIPMGLDLHGVARNLTGQELRIAIKPATWPDDWADRANSPDAVEGVGTGAGEGAPGQDTGSAWVTRSTDCPEAPAQAHSLGPYCATCGAAEHCHYPGGSRYRSCTFSPGRKS